MKQNNLSLPYLTMESSRYSSTAIFLETGDINSRDLQILFYKHLYNLPMLKCKLYIHLFIKQLYNIYLTLNGIYIMHNIHILFHGWVSISPIMHFHVQIVENFKIIYTVTSVFLNAYTSSENTLSTS